MLNSFLKILVLFLILIISPIIHAQQVTFYDRSSNGVALSQSTVASPNAFGVYSNMGAIGFVDQSVVNFNGGIYYGIPELKHFQAGALLKLTGSDRLALTINHFGDPDYRESTFGLGYSRKISNSWGLGFKANYSLLDITEFGNSGNWSFEGGILGKITENLLLGYQGRYIMPNDQFTDLKIRHQGGIHFQPIEALTFTLSGIYFGSWSIQGGLQYYLIESLWIKVGANSLEPSYSMGIGYQISDYFSVEAALQYHSILGSSPFLGMVYQFANSN